MKLFNIPRKSKILLEVSDGSSFCIFERIDGIYSVCITEKNNIIHLSASTELIKENEVYRLANE